jgi:parallel beta-helix repeat protein
MKRPIFAKFTRYGILSVALLSFAPLVQAVVINVACPGQTVQSAIDLAQPGDTVSVTGTCNENILVRNEKQRIAIVGSGGAVINGLITSSPAINVRGKGIGIQGFTITGGSRGVHLNRNSNAFINGNTIQNTGGDGILVDELAFASIYDNTISNNPFGNGIMVSENAVTRIGFNLSEDVSPSPNTITFNGANGIMVSRSSSARIVGNTISNNLVDGIFVTRSAQADIASNVINANGGSAVKISENGSVVLGESNPTNFFQQPNTTTVNNTGFGIQCDQGGAVRAVLGSSNAVNGNAGQLNLHASCPFTLAP